MLPSLGALSLVPTGAVDDVITEILAERAETARSEVLGNDDLLKKVLSVLAEGGTAWEACKLVSRWCGLDKDRRAACDDDFWNDMVTRIWGDAVQQIWPSRKPRSRFIAFCRVEREFRIGDRNLVNYSQFNDVKRIVLASIASQGLVGLLGRRAELRLQLVSVRLRDDEDVVRAAVAMDPLEIRLASERLQALINPLRPTEYWPATEPTHFERTWGEDLQRILLFNDWDKLSVRIMKRLLTEEYPAFDADYWLRNERKFEELLDKLWQHIDACAAPGPDPNQDQNPNQIPVVLSWFG